VESELKIFNHLKNRIETLLAVTLAAISNPLEFGDAEFAKPAE